MENNPEDGQDVGPLSFISSSLNHVDKCLYSLKQAETKTQIMTQTSSGILLENQHQLSVFILAASPRDSAPLATHSKYTELLCSRERKQYGQGQAERNTHTHTHVL